jgi:hypothetical protein
LTFLSLYCLGTIAERGIATWQNVDDPTTAKKVYVEGYSIYNPWLPERIKNSRFIRYIPFLPNPEEGDIPHTLTDEIFKEDSNSCKYAFNDLCEIH